MSSEEAEHKRPRAAASSSDDASLSKEVQEAVDKFSYMRFTLCDLNGIARSKLVARDRFRYYMQKGVTAYGAVMCFGTLSDMLQIKEILELRYGNMLMRPQSGTLHALPWAAGGKYPVGELFCETAWLPPYRDGAPQAACPRYMARRQLQRLADLGYKLMSAFETEFVILRGGDSDATPLRPLFTGRATMNNLITAEHEALFFSMFDRLRAAGVDIDMFHPECSDGEFEVTTVPSFGISAADQMFTLKEAIKEMCTQEGYTVTFMTVPGGMSSGSQCTQHFNHSLWTTTAGDDGRPLSALYDPSDESQFSAVGRRWVSGLVRHAAALTAICSPTVNCYRRYGMGACDPTCADWGYDDRTAMIRVKCEGSAEQTLVENRLPGSAANPYLIMAATVAAGIDGLVNQLPCQPPSNSKVAGQRSEREELPRSLSAALAALETDPVMVDALGEEFARWFTQLKRRLEIDRVNEATQSGHSAVDVEHELYFKHI